MSGNAGEALNRAGAGRYEAPLSIGEARRNASSRLAGAGIDTPGLDARVLLAHVSGLCDAALVLADRDDTLDPETLSRFDEVILRRLSGEPVAYITGEKEFWGRSLRVSPDTLIPRADSETLIEICVQHLDNPQAVQSVLDLGTGSGCLLVAALDVFPVAEGLGLDRSARALAVARDNLARHGMDHRSRLAVGDWASAVRGSFDVVLSNPPYITRAEMMDLPLTVGGFEPHGALDGGLDGLDPFRQILAQLEGLLSKTGIGVIECSPAQKPALSDLVSAQGGLKVLGFGKDLGGRVRCVAIERA